MMGPERQEMVPTMMSRAGICDVDFASGISGTIPGSFNSA
jgi:hypothetical protein